MPAQPAIMPPVAVHLMLRADTAAAIEDGEW